MEVGGDNNSITVTTVANRVLKRREVTGHQD